MTAPTDLPAFQQYQLQFTGHIRDPKNITKPARVAANRMRVYREIVYNNLESSLAGCFPVCKKVLGKRLWHKLVRGFFAHHQSHSPLFRQIPEEFLAFLGRAHQFADIPQLPGYLNNLAHYEWIELAVSAAEPDNDWSRIDVHGDLLTGMPVLATAMALLSYDYPVQVISPRFKPKQPLQQAVNLLVFRDADDQVRFIELNALTARLLSLLQAHDLTGRQALQQIAEEIRHPDPVAMMEFGRAVLEDLRQQGVILGVFDD
ncbi:MAG: DUF2063 domain-containing protein [Betaproteobacteria bacterium HGW-Betaproteobacteria-2]|nr:MAG: DUF2063 domain-containing protein [Betaproteobacteria bacterium HGW-Betaproteobacteria-2]